MTCEPFHMTFISRAIAIAIAIRLERFQRTRRRASRRLDFFFRLRLASRLEIHSRAALQSKTTG